MSLQHLWQMSYESKVIDILRNSKHAIPIIQSFHLFGIVLLLSSTVIINFRLLGIGLRGIRLAVLTREAWKWGKVGLLLAMIAGFLTKMSLLLMAILFQFTVYRKVVRAESVALEPRRHFIVPLLSLTLWFGVGWAGRAIAFLG
jgi:hypothetical protein